MADAPHISQPGADLVQDLITATKEYFTTPGISMTLLLTAAAARAAIERYIADLEARNA